MDPAIIKQQIEKDTRSNSAKENFIKDITTKTGYKRNAVVNNAELFRYADSVTAKNKTVLRTDSFSMTQIFGEKF